LARQAQEQGLNWADFIEAVWQFALVTGISFVLLCLLASLIRFYQLQHPGLLRPDAEVDDATRFSTQIAARLGSAYRLPVPFCVLLAAGPDLAAPTHRDLFLATLKSVVRRADVVLQVDDHTVGVLVDERRSGLENLIARLQTATASFGSTRFGAASCPENGNRAKGLLEAARTALPAAGAGWNIAQFAEPASAPTVPAAAPEPAPARQDAWLDALTGVLKPERLGRLMPKFVARYRRDGLPVSMICFDVDYLGRYNDHYGRAAGDAILHGIAQVLQQYVREGDLIGRTAGDGFVVLLDCPPVIALAVAERLANQIKRATFSSGDFTLKTTVSGGVAGYPDHGRTAEVILDAAHAALLAAQERGRNMSLLFDVSMRPYQTLNRGPDEF